MERESESSDPALSGSALDFVTGYVKKNGQDGWNLFEQLKKNEVTVAGANQEALDPVVTVRKIWSLRVLII